MCACISTTLLQPEEFVVCCCTAGRNEQGPVELSCSGALMSSEAAVVGVLAWCLTSPGPARHPSLPEMLTSCSLCSAILSHSSRHMLKKGCFQDQRGALDAECCSGLPSSSWVISLPSTPKRLCLDSQDAASNTIVKMPHCTLCTGYSTENQDPPDGG